MSKHNKSKLEKFILLLSVVVLGIFIAAVVFAIINHGDTSSIKSLVYDEVLSPKASEYLAKLPKQMGKKFLRNCENNSGANMATIHIQTKSKRFMV